MTAPRRVPALAVPVDARSAVTFLGYPNRSPLLAITTGRALLVTLTLPEPPGGGARRVRPPAGVPGDGVRGGGRAPVPGPGPAARPRAGDGMTAIAGDHPAVRAYGAVKVEPFIRLTGSTLIRCCTSTTTGADPGHR